MISFLQGRALSNKKKYSTPSANVAERLEGTSLDCLEDATTATISQSTGAHSNTFGYGRVSIGVQAGVPAVTSTGTYDITQRNNEAETRDVDELTCGVEGGEVEEETCRGISVGVDAGQQVGGKIEMGNFFQGGELVSITTCHDHILHLDLGSNITVTGGNFRTVHGDFYELPEEFKRLVKSCHLTAERFADL